MAIDNGFLTGTQLMNKKLSPVTMLTSFLPSSSYVLLSGAPGAGKTEFLIQQAIEIASKDKVMFFCNEGGLNDLQQRQNAYCKNEKVLDNLLWPQRGFPNFKDSIGIEAFEFIIEKFQPKAVFIDPEPDAFGEENDAALLKEPLLKIYSLIQAHDFCLVLSWHTPKELSFTGVYAFRGSSTIAAKADVMYLLSGYSKKRLLQLHKLRMSCPDLCQGQRWNIERADHEDGKSMKFTKKEESETLAEQRHQAELQALSGFEAGAVYTKTEFKNIYEKHLTKPLPDSSSDRLLERFRKSGLFTLAKRGIGPKPSLYRFNGLDSS